MFMSLTITNTAGSLGDWLSITPLLAASPNSIVIAKDSPHTREFATLYQGLAEVKFTNENIPPINETDEPICFSKRILNAYGFKNQSPIPIIRLNDDEIDWAKTFLNEYKNPIAFNNTTASSRRDKPDNDICNYRRLPDELSRDIVKTLKEDGFSILKFGCKNKHVIYNNFDEINGVINIPDLSLRQVAACYKIIGKYIGTDTGDHHLMLSVGGKCELFVPQSTWHYNHAKHLYNLSVWGNEEPREGYNIFKKI